MYSELLLYLFIGWSISSTLVNGSIFDGIRNWLLIMSPFFGKLFSCVRCSSFWIGFFLFSFLTYEDFLGVVFHGLPIWINYIFLPFLQSGFSVVVESFVIFLVKERGIKIYEEVKEKNDE